MTPEERIREAWLKCKAEHAHSEAVICLPGVGGVVRAAIAEERKRCAGIGKMWWGADHRGGTCDCLPCRYADAILARTDAD